MSAGAASSGWPFSTSQRQRRQQQCVVGHHDLRLAHVVARLQHRALLGEAAAAAGASRRRRGDARTQGRRDGFGRGIQIAVPQPVGMRFQQPARRLGLVRRQRAVVELGLVVAALVGAERGIAEHAGLAGLAMQLGGVARAQVARAALGQRDGRLDAGRLQERGNVAFDQLRLQGHGAGADDQLLLRRQRDRHARGHVGQALADAGRRLGDADAARRRQCTRHKGDHLALRAAGAEAGGIGLQLRVRIADVGLQRVGQRARRRGGRFGRRLEFGFAHARIFPRAVPQAEIDF